MSLDGLLIHTCTIENPGAGSTNVYNNKVPAYGTPLTGVRCRLIEDRERVWSDERQESTIQSVYKLMVKGDVTISERAKVSLITLENETTVNDTFVVVEVLHRRGRNSHHQTAMLERIS